MEPHALIRESSDICEDEAIYGVSTNSFP